MTLQKVRLILNPITREYRFENKQIHKEYRGNYLSYVSGLRELWKEKMRTKSKDN
ncbi:MAG: hypothetical protein ACJAWV_004530 [Flammeovirgaceae bacterium]|jgi:hypothetical protein